MLYYYYNIVQMATQSASPPTQPTPGPSWRNANYTRGRARGRQTIMCHNCKKFGHTRQYCPKKCKYLDK